MKKHLLSIIFFVGFVLIFIFLPRIITLIATSINLKIGSGVSLLGVVLGWYLWGKVCYHIKETFDLEE